MSAIGLEGVERVLRLVEMADEQLALGGLLRLVIRADGAFTEEEEQRVNELGDELGGRDALWKAISDSAQAFPEDADIPLSRRPRDRMRLSADGTASLLLPGPDDRYLRKPARWRSEAGEPVLRAEGDAFEWRIVAREPARLVVRKRKATD